MNIRIFLTLFISLMLLCGEAQSLWQDVAELKKYMVLDTNENRMKLESSVATDRQAIFHILDKYCPDSTRTKDGQRITLNLSNCFQQNPFFTFSGFSDTLSIPDPYDPRNERYAKRDTTKKNSLLAHYLDESTEYTARRKIVDQLFPIMRDDFRESSEIQGLFPETEKLMLRELQDEVFVRDDFILALRIAYIRDLYGVSTRIGELADNSARLKKGEDRIKISDAQQLAQYLINGGNAIDLLDFLANDARASGLEPLYTFEDPKAKEQLRSFASNITQLDLLVKSIKSDGANRLLIDAEEIKDALSDSTFSMIFKGLLYQSCSNTSYGDQFRQILGEKSSPVNQEPAFIDYLPRLSETLNTQYRSAKAEPTPPAKTAHTVFTEWLFPELNELEKVFFDIDKPVKNPFQEAYFELSEQFYELEVAVRDNNFLYASSLIISILELSERSGNILYKTVPISAHLLLLGTLADAETIQGMYRGIESNQLAAGSSVMKREAAFSANLNAYIGVNMGREYLLRVADSSKDGNTIAAHIPIGLDISFQFKKNRTLGTFFQVLDMGMLMSYSFSTKSTPQLAWKNVIAPGLYLNYYFPKSPLTLSIGGQLGPLERIISEGPPPETATAFRLGFSLLVDVPLFNIVQY